ncbi:MAG: chemotaxis protein CheC [Arcobacteraceae bacterium]
MKDMIELNEEERDCLQELMNISYGAATAAISEIIGKFATLSIPSIKSISTVNLIDHLNQKLLDKNQYYVVNQLINGYLAGENIFIIDEVSSLNLAREFDLEEDECTENEIKDIILEITNILSSVTSGKLAALIDTSISFSAPNITKINSVDEFDKRFAGEYSHVIIISTELNFEEQNIKGDLMILTKKESSVFLQQALNTALDNL